MVIHPANGLQISVANRCAEKLEASFFHVFTQGIGQRR
jgi:hypothetical protein